MTSVIILDFPQNALASSLAFSDLPLAFAAAATISFLLGFRSHYSVWHPKGMEEEKKKTSSRNQPLLQNEPQR
jgi:hypothetical protein